MTQHLQSSTPTSAESLFPSWCASLTLEDVNRHKSKLPDFIGPASLVRPSDQRVHPPPTPPWILPYRDPISAPSPIITEKKYYFLGLARVHTEQLVDKDCTSCQFPSPQYLPSRFTRAMNTRMTPNAPVLAPSYFPRTKPPFPWHGKGSLDMLREWGCRMVRKLSSGRRDSSSSVRRSRRRGPGTVQRGTACL